MLGMFQPQVLPIFAAILGAINTIAVAHAALAVAFAGAHPHDAGIFRIEGHGSDGIGTFVIEDWRPSGAAVLRFPNATRSAGHKITSVILGIDSEGQHAARDHRRADGAQLQAIKGPR